jgi:hypothetical protein
MLKNVSGSNSDHINAVVSSILGITTDRANCALLKHKTFHNLLINLKISFVEREYNADFKIFKNIEINNTLMYIYTDKENFSYDGTHILDVKKSKIKNKNKKYQNNRVYKVLFIKKDQLIDKEAKCNSIALIFKSRSIKDLKKEYVNFESLVDEIISEKFGEDFFYSLDSDKEYKRAFIRAVNQDNLLACIGVEDLYVYSILLLLEKRKLSLQDNILKNLNEVLIEVRERFKL